MSGLDRYIAHRLIATGVVAGEDEPSQESFDSAYEADIAAVVRRVLREEGLL